MQKLTLGLRIGMAFGVLILLMCVLGGLTVWRLNLASTSALEVSSKHAPEVQIAHAVNVVAWETIYDIRSYSSGGDEAFLNKGRKKIAEIKERLKDAESLAEKFSDLVTLRKGAIQAGDKVAEYEALVDKTEVAFKSLAAQQAAFNESGKMFIQACQLLRISQQKKMNAAIDELAGTAKPQLLEAKQDLSRVRSLVVKTGLIEDIINAGNSIRIANFNFQNAKDMGALSNLLKEFDPLEKETGTLAALLETQEDIGQLEKVREATEQYKLAMQQVLKSKEAIEEHSLQRGLVADKVVAVAGSVANGGLQEISKAAVDVTDGLAATTLILITGVLVTLILAVLVAWRSSHAITMPIREGVNALAATAAEISATIAQLASSASQAATATIETTSTVEEIRQTAQVSADKARSVADSAQGAARAAETGRHATEQTIEGLSRIRDQMTVIGESITRLNEHSQAVGEIVSTVADLAGQSNLLAVNASIEAAKAGEMGKGFAVVAQEIRNLADQSEESTKQVRGILAEVQKATGKAVLSAELGGKSVLDGGKQAEEAGQAIRSLSAAVQESSRAAVQISASSQQQLAGMEQVGRAMESIKQVAMQNAEGSRQLGTAARNLQEIGARLRALVGGDAGKMTVEK